jgi:hypothetical protein
MTTIYTTAPADYDWGNATREIAIVGKTRNGKTVRKVETRDNLAEEQGSRYASGCHMAVDEIEWQKLISYNLVEVIA